VGGGSFPAAAAAAPSGSAKQTTQDKQDKQDKQEPLKTDGNGWKRMETDGILTQSARKSADQNIKILPIS
jgi:hypothetical protein